MAQLSNTPRQQTQLMLEVRKSFSLGLWFKTRDRDDYRRLVDLTGATITFVMAKQPYQGGDIVITENASLLVPDAGYARLNLQALDLDLEPGIYLYSFTLVTAEGYSAVVIKGEAEVVDNTNPSTVNTYTNGNPPESLTVELMADNEINVIVDALAGGELEIGTVTTAAPGAPASADITGAWPHQVLDLVLPIGSGGGGGAYIHSQPTPAATWTIVHNLGYKPDLRLFLTADPTVRVYTDVTYPDTNTAVVTWPSAESGWAEA